MSNINDYGFPFSSVSNDRQYSAGEWRKYFGTLIKDGVVQNALNECQVKPQTLPNKTVFVDTGAIFIQGAMRILESAENLSIDDNTSGNSRIDRIVARLNFADRKIELAVLKGTPSSSPTAKTLTRNTSVWELALADITLTNGFSTIVGTAITDQRPDTDLCGASSMTIGVIPPSGNEAVTVGLSPGTSSKYGEANVDDALDKISNCLYFGLISQLSGGDGKTGNQDGYIAFSTTDIDEIGAAGSSQFIIPTGVKRVRFYFKGQLNASYLAGLVSVRLHKNGTDLGAIAQLSDSQGCAINTTFYSLPTECNPGDIFKLYGDPQTIGEYSSSISAGAIFGMEVLK